MALPIDGHDVIAVVEHNHVDEPLEVALQVPGVVEVGVVVLAGMDDQGRLMNAAKLGADGLDEAPVLQNGATRRARKPGNAAVTTLESIADERPDALVLDAVRVEVRKADQVGDPAAENQTKKAGIPGDEPAIEPERGGQQGRALHVGRAARGQK